MPAAARAAPRSGPMPLMYFIELEKGMVIGGRGLYHSLYIEAKWEASIARGSDGHIWGLTGVSHRTAVRLPGHFAWAPFVLVWRGAGLGFYRMRRRHLR